MELKIQHWNPQKIAPDPSLKLSWPNSFSQSCPGFQVISIQLAHLPSSKTCLVVSSHPKDIGQCGIITNRMENPRWKGTTFETTSNNPNMYTLVVSANCIPYPIGFYIPMCWGWTLTSSRQSILPLLWPAGLEEQQRPASAEEHGVQIPTGWISRNGSSKDYTGHLYLSIYYLSIYLDIYIYTYWYLNIYIYILHI